MRNTIDDPTWTSFIYHDHVSWFPGKNLFAFCGTDNRANNGGPCKIKIAEKSMPFTHNLTIGLAPYAVIVVEIKASE